MASLQNQARLFGLDLQPLGVLLRAAVADMAGWRWIRWLFPETPVALRLPNGHWAQCDRPQQAPRVRTDWVDERMPAKARGHVVALVPPEDLVLRWSTVLPPSLSKPQRQQSLALEVAARSPFPVSDTVWGSQSDAQSPGREHVVLASRRLLGEHWGSNHAALLERISPSEKHGGEMQMLSTIEVWVTTPGASGYVPMAGFGEAVRARRNRIKALIAGTLLFLTLTAVMAIVVTPTAQLYLRLQAARHSLQTLATQSADAVELRQAMVRETERVARLQQLLDQPVSPVDALLQINEAVPDDAFLRSLEISGAKVTLSGETPVAASLMTRLSNTPGFSGVRAPRPATKPPGRSLESFTIELQLAPSPVATSTDGSGSSEAAGSPSTDTSGAKQP